MLTTFAALLAKNTRFGHWLAVKIGMVDLHAMFCPCCPEWAGFGEDIEADDLD